MMSELEKVRTQCEKAATDMLQAINAFEHALADATTVESVQVVREVIGGCYHAFDRINSAATSRHAHLSVMRDIAERSR